MSRDFVVFFGRVQIDVTGSLSFNWQNLWSIFVNLGLRLLYRVAEGNLYL